MKTIVIGDIHGRTEWKDIVKEHGIDGVEYIFLGDYLDSHDNISTEVQYNNFIEILNFKESNPDSVTLLIGNHDLHYYDPIRFRCSQFSYNMYKLIKTTIESCVLDGTLEFVKADFDRKLIYSHAGISKEWLKNTYNTKSINPKIISKMKISDFAFSENGKDLSGDDTFQSPAWIRPGSLVLSSIDGFIQFVGHTRFNDELIYTYKNDCKAIYFCDSMPNEYIIIDDKIKIEKLNAK